MISCRLHRARRLFPHTSRNARSRKPMVTCSAAVRTYEEKGMQDVLLQSISPRPVDFTAGTFGTYERVTRQRHCLLTTSLPGSHSVLPNPPKNPLKRPDAETSEQESAEKTGPKSRPYINIELRGVGMMFADVCRSQETNAEIAFIAGIAAEWSYEENTVKNVFQQPSSSGPVDGVAAAVGARERLTVDRHGPLLPFWLGPIVYTQICFAARGHWRTGWGSKIAAFANGDRIW
jgi:hypothetical protein